MDILLYLVEFLVFIVSIICSFKFLVKWYEPLLSKRPLNRNKSARYILGLLPIGSFCVILFTLKMLASFDVVDSFIYISMYMVLGIAWLFLGATLMSCVFDLSWLDDALNLNNKAALIAVVGGFLGLTLIYSGANIGNGPGWWCVVFTGGLGLVAWIVLGLVINSCTKTFERITVERDIGCGIRFGSYLLASGIILARACAGDWTSFYITLVEFIDGWSVLVLAGILILVELYYIHKAKSNKTNNAIFGSIFLAVVFIAMAITIVYLLPPTSGNPIYRVALEVFWSLHI
ncbi:hypothetical protein [Candidatus Bathycorpusculum sp.]|jgi:uncharacterized membrane protein|uniref:DUF350 domain-containing protein n=1 Tax=Candidatus Bathycorpusculum sp. TaxID=2994959 RepID=UPI00281E7FF3|nr:hypothetical protein [Candidatus Termitimicrobium sp.]MCL2431454.1 hypothetical protein [Candidatus Termitimicrobium sp.]